MAQDPKFCEIKGCDNEVTVTEDDMFKCKRHLLLIEKQKTPELFCIIRGCTNENMFKGNKCFFCADTKMAMLFRFHHN